MTEGTCERCTDPFVDRSPTQNRRFCSDNCRKRTAAQQHLATCKNCGGKLATEGSGGWATGRPYERCLACENERRLAATEERGHRIEKWWADGLTLKEIAARLDTTHGFVGVEMCRLRAKGFDLPKRRPYYGNGRDSYKAAA